MTGVGLGWAEIGALASGVHGALTITVTSGPAFRLNGAVFDGATFRSMPGVMVTVGLDNIVLAR